jgi:protein-disulfide isomerase
MSAKGHFERHPLAILAALVALGAAGSMLTMRPAVEVLSLRPSAALEAIVNDPGSPAWGPRDADGVMVVFTDYQCPVCRATDGALERRLDSDRHIRVVFKDWPILGPGSIWAARIALAAARQGRYLPMHRALMRSRDALTPASLDLIALQAGVDAVRLQADLVRDGAAIDAQLARHAAQARSLGLEGTPGYVVGLKLARGGLSGRDLDRLIAEAKAPSAAARASINRRGARP